MREERRPFVGTEPDDDLFDDEIETPPEPEPQERQNQVIRDLRQKAKRLKQIEPEYEALKEFRTQVETKEKVSKTATVFEQARISPKLAPLFLKEHRGDEDHGLAGIGLCSDPRRERAARTPPVQHHASPHSQG